MISAIPSDTQSTIIIALKLGNFVVNPPAPDPHKRKRQQVSSSDPFILTGNATNSGEGCSNAAKFTLQNGQLSTSAGLVETNLTESFQVFDVSPYTATYTTTWAFDGNNLNWNNPVFGPNGTAYFCDDPNGILYILFNSDTDDSYPTDCVIVSLLSIPGRYSTIMYYTALLTHILKLNTVKTTQLCIRPPPLH